MAKTQAMSRQKAEGEVSTVCVIWAHLCVVHLSTQITQRDGTAMYRRSADWVQSGEWKRKMIGAVGTDRDPRLHPCFFVS